MSVSQELVCRRELRVAQPVLAVRGRSAVGDLPAFFGHAYGAVMRYLAELGEAAAGPPYAAYYSMDMRDLDVEAGFPVARPLPGRGEVLARELPAGEVATALHVGPYDRVEQTYNALSAWVSEQGLVPAGEAYEQYLNSPLDTPPDQLRTLVVFPVAMPA